MLFHGRACAHHLEVILDGGCRLLRARDRRVDGLAGLRLGQLVQELFLGLRIVFVREVAPSVPKRKCCPKALVVRVVDRVRLADEANARAAVRGAPSFCMLRDGALRTRPRCRRKTRPAL